MQQGVTQIDIDEFHRLGVEAVLERVHAVVGAQPCYVSFDIDVLDPAFACGTVMMWCYYSRLVCLQCCKRVMMKC